MRFPFPVSDFYFQDFNLISDGRNYIFERQSYLKMNAFFTLAKMWNEHKKVSKEEEIN